MKYITLNQSYIDNIINRFPRDSHTEENHRLISKMDENGNIYGSTLLFNHKDS